MLPTFLGRWTCCTETFSDSCERAMTVRWACRLFYHPAGYYQRDLYTTCSCMNTSTSDPVLMASNLTCHFLLDTPVLGILCRDCRLSGARGTTWVAAEVGCLLPLPETRGRYAAWVLPGLRGCCGRTCFLC